MQVTGVLCVPPPDATARLQSKAGPGPVETQQEGKLHGDQPFPTLTRYTSWMVMGTDVTSLPE